MYSFEMFLRGIAIPSTISAMIIGFCWMLWKRDSARQPFWAAPLALGAGFCVAAYMIGGWSGFPPGQTKNWPMFIAAAGAILAVLRHFLPKKLAIDLATAVPLVGLVAWAILIRRNPASAVGVAAAVVAMIGIVASVERAARRPGASVPFYAMTWAGLSALAIGLSGSALFAELCGSIASVLGPIWVAAMLRGRVSMAHGATLVLVPTTCAIILAGYRFAELPTESLVALGASGLVMGLDALPAMSTKPWWFRMGIVASAVGLFGAVAVGFAFNASPPLII